MFQEKLMQPEILLYNLDKTLDLNYVILSIIKKSAVFR